MNLNKFLIIEDDWENFLLLHSIISEMNTECTIRPLPEKTNYNKLQELYSDYLATPNDTKETELKNFIDIVPDFIILDFSLRNNRTGRMDTLGGILRKKFIEKNYKNAMVIFMSIYGLAQIQRFMAPTDVYISKLLPETGADKKTYWKQRLKFHINKP